jgi:hypothetical protein
VNLRELIVLRLPHVHFCFTSRPEVDIRSAIQDLAVHNVSLHEQVGQNQDIFDYIEFIFSSDPQIQRWKEEDKQLAKDTHPLEGSSRDVIHESMTQPHDDCRIYLHIDSLQHCEGSVGSSARLKLCVNVFLLVSDVLWMICRKP